MSSHTFLLTYSVSPRAIKYEDTANVIRNRIARLHGSDGLIKLANVETVFKGTIILNNLSRNDKLREAKSIIEILSNNKTILCLKILKKRFVKIPRIVGIEIIIKIT